MDRTFTNHIIKTSNCWFNDYQLCLGQYYYCSYGYGTAEHIAAIKKYGPCPAHRKSFEPIKSWE